MKVSDIKKYLDTVDDDFNLEIKVYRRDEKKGSYPLEIVKTTDLEFIDISYSDNKIVFGLESIK